MLTGTMKKRRLGKKAEIFVLPADRRGLIRWRPLLRFLGKKGITRVLIEGGAQVLGTAFAEKVVDEIYLFIAPVMGGARRSIRGPGDKFLERISKARSCDALSIGNDLLLHGIL